jgi:hypothetical protein
MKMGYRLPIALTISKAITPFVNPPNIKEKIQWVQSKLVCEIEYAELTATSNCDRRSSRVGETIGIQKKTPLEAS